MWLLAHPRGSNLILFRGGQRHFLLTSFNNSQIFFAFLCPSLFPYLFLKGKMQLCSTFMLGRSRGKQRMIVALLQQNTEGCSIYATSLIFLGWRCWNLQCINFFFYWFFLMVYINRWCCSLIFLVVSNFSISKENKHCL